jgi:hypothetical protein
MVVKDLKIGTTFSIGTSSNSEWISNENSKKFPGLEFNRIYFLELQLWMRLRQDTFICTLCPT